MKRKPSTRSAFFKSRALIGFLLCFVGLALGFFAIGGLTGRSARAQGTLPDPLRVGPTPQERIAIRSARSFHGDLRLLPYIAPVKKERPEREPPPLMPRLYQPLGGTSAATSTSSGSTGIAPTANAPAPAPISTFDGLDFANWGAGHPPDPNGDVGPTYYIQVVNTSIGIYDKSTGTRVAAFTFDTFMSQGQFGNLCDTDNFGDPVVLYDSFEDRWVITDFAFKIDGSGNVVNPPGSFQCFAVSKSGDPVNGGWNFYSINTSGGLGDYPKFGVWTDGIYMSANMFDYAASGSFQNVRVYAFNKAQMYSGAPTMQVVSFDVDPADFTVLPSNARLQTGTPPAGRPNLYISTWEYLNALTVYKFHVDWNHISLSTFTGPDIPATGSSWPNQPVPNAATPVAANTLDVLQIRAMAQNQYSKIGGTESLWTTHTVRRATNGNATPRWYQVNVTGGTVAASTLQTATWDPDAANTNYRYVPSLAVDRAGDMAIGYTLSNSTTNPAIKYAGRLSTDAANTFSQTEQTLWQGTGSQSGNCGASACTRWGDYTAMTLDPDGCTFWYTNEYYAVNGLNDLTRIGKFNYSQCTPVGNGGTISGQVTVSGSGTPIGGATVALGSRTTTTDNNGNYSFSVPAGTYPSITASASGYDSATQTTIVVNDSATTTKNFSLVAAPTTGCLTDTTQGDFQTGVPTNTDLTSSPGNVELAASTTIDQQNTSVGNIGNTITTTIWEAQTFIPGASGQLTRIDADLFCSGCSGTNPAVTIDIRSTSGGAPSSTILATTTIPGFSSGSAVYYSASFSSPPTLTAGTAYGIVARLVTNRTTGVYAWLRSGNNAYASGAQYISTNSGSSWSVQGTDLGFKTYMLSGFAPSGDFVSSAKDANPANGFVAKWSTLSWTASVPGNTTLSFQAAASNDASGIFNFVGPDGTANTFFSNGGSLSQFNGYRYLKYKALFATSNSSLTPTLNDATVCFDSSQTGPQLSTVVSRMTHGSITMPPYFDTTLPLTGTRGVECRSSTSLGAGNYQMVFQFDNALTSVGGATVTTGTGSVSSSSIGLNNHEYIVNLTGVTNQQYIAVTLSRVAGVANGGTVVGPQMGVLVGDVSANGSVDGNDVSATQSGTRQPVTSTNFRLDVTASGLIDGNDVSLVQSQTRTSLPSSP